MSLSVKHFYTGPRSMIVRAELTFVAEVPVTWEGSKSPREIEQLLEDARRRAQELVKERMVKAANIQVKVKEEMRLTKSSTGKESEKK